MTGDPSLFFFGAFGALAQEIVHWYELRHKLQTKRLQALLKSWGYWIITVLMILVSAAGVWALYSESGIPRDLQVIVGGAFPALLKKLVSAASGRAQPTLGTSPVREYFQA